MHVAATIDHWKISGLLTGRKWLHGLVPSPDTWPPPPDLTRLGVPDGIPLPGGAKGFALDVYRKRRVIWRRTPAGRELFRFKYCNDLSAGWRLAHAAARALQALELIEQITLIIPAPHAFVYRRYLPAPWLARKIGYFLDKQVLDDVFHHTRFPSRQKTLMAGNRKPPNIAGAYAIEGNHQLALDGHSVLLVDDVSCSGQTFRELKQVLLRHGVAQVISVAMVITDANR